MLGELRGVLEQVARPRGRTRLVLSLRDVVDGPDSVQALWARDGVRELLDHVYDLIVVHGWRDSHDLVAECGLSAAAAAKVRYLGYPRPEPDRHAS